MSINKEQCGFINPVKHVDTWHVCLSEVDLHLQWRPICQQVIMWNIVDSPLSQLIAFKRCGSDSKIHSPNICYELCSYQAVFLKIVQVWMPQTMFRDMSTLVHVIPWRQEIIISQIWPRSMSLCALSCLGRPVLIKMFLSQVKFRKIPVLLWFN